MGIEQYLKEYKELTLYMIERIKIDGNIQYLVEKRQSILNAVSQSDFSKEEIKRIGNLLELGCLENELSMAVKSERIKIKKEIGNLKKMYHANMGYTKIGEVPSRFNKKM